MKAKVFVVSLVMVFSLVLAACGGKDKVKNENAAIPGRDKELYEQASKKAEKGRYDEARLLYNVVITTYADSEYLPLAKLAIADSFYLEGGNSNLEQAIGGYKDFAQYFPTHPKICEVKHKIAQSFMRQMGAYNRDVSNARKAEQQLKSASQTCQSSPMMAAIKNDLNDVQQVLGLHEIDISRFYLYNRQAYKAAESRLRDIVTNYPFFSYFDESLYLLGVSLVEQEQPEEATEYFTRLVRDYSNSEFAKKGKEYLEKLGKPIPEPSNNNPAPERPNFVGKFGLILGRNGLDITKDGVLLSKKGDEKSDVKEEALKKPSDASNATGTRGIRASTKGAVEPAAANQPASATPAASTPAANQPAKPETKQEENKSGDTKKEDKKKKDKKKGGVLGIFR
ncbi:MAG TPA: outer membrane protein assembly factor BamD [Blastocatellia bacterium]|nr:outer membrane protein assembly factor BamD [Blastocatellia bacterium]HMZ16386.1 outer membrane protein assembly factor BamD [Blastocatellia bacterium]HNG34098.1 outer membrane protein assembly factor BamD [Blastocatellia bacterium]